MFILQAHTYTLRETETERQRRRGRVGGDIQSNISRNKTWLVLHNVNFSMFCLWFWYLQCTVETPVPLTFINTYSIMQYLLRALSTSATYLCLSFIWFNKWNSYWNDKGLLSVVHIWGSFPQRLLWGIFFLSHINSFIGLHKLSHVELKELYLKKRQQILRPGNVLSPHLQLPREHNVYTAI